MCPSWPGCFLCSSGRPWVSCRTCGDARGFYRWLRFVEVRGKRHPGVTPVGWARRLASILICRAALRALPTRRSLDLSSDAWARCCAIRVVRGEHWVRTFAHPTPRRAFRDARHSCGWLRFVEVRGKRHPGVTPVGWARRLASILICRAALRALPTRRSLDLSSDAWARCCAIRVVRGELWVRTFAHPTPRRAFRDARHSCGWLRFVEVRGKRHPGVTPVGWARRLASILICRAALRALPTRRSLDLSSDAWARCCAIRVVRGELWVRIFAHLTPRRAFRDARHSCGWLRFVEVPRERSHGTERFRYHRPDQCSLRAIPWVDRAGGKLEGHAGGAETAVAQAAAHFRPVASFRRNAGQHASRSSIGRIVEVAHRALARRQRAPLVAVDRREPGDRVALAQRQRIEVEARAPRPLDVDLRGGDPGREFAALGPAIGAGDRARQGVDLA